MAEELGWEFVVRKVLVPKMTLGDSGSPKTASKRNLNLTLEIAARYWGRPTGEPCQQFGPRDVVALATLWVTGVHRVSLYEDGFTILICIQYRIYADITF